MDDRPYRLVRCCISHRRNNTGFRRSCDCRWYCWLNLIRSRLDGRRGAGRNRPSFCWYDTPSHCYGRTNGVLRDQLHSFRDRHDCLSLPNRQIPFLSLCMYSVACLGIYRDRKRTTLDEHLLNKSGALRPDTKQVVLEVKQLQTIRK